MTELPAITIAVICKNEAANIERCLSSIVRESAGLAAEIIVVDSFSTDGTVELAKNYPVTIVQLGRDWPHSPAAGRYMAVLYARGRYLLLIDGDMELLPGYISAALAQMEADPSVVAVRGRLHNYHSINGEPFYVNSKFATSTANRKNYIDITKPVAIEWASGSALFQLQAVREAGNFHPFLKAEEEFELAQRLRTRKGKILYIPVDAVNHYGYLPDPLAEVGRRLHSGLVGGIGQMVRLSFQEGYGWKILARFRQQLIISCFFLLLMPVFLFAGVFPLLPLIWLCLFLLLLAAYWNKKRYFRMAIAACLLNALIGLEILKGMFTPVPSRENYPSIATIIYGAGTDIRGMG